jgi:hypothetical protein
VAVIGLLLELAAGDHDLLGVHHDDEVAGVAMRRVVGLQLPAERVGDPGRHAAEVLALGVDDVPVALAVLRCRYVGLHGIFGRGRVTARKPRLAWRLGAAR